MSATRDTSQKIGWTGGNVYDIFKGRKSNSEFKLTTFEPMKNNLTELHRLHWELKQMIDDLEKLVGNV